MLAVTVLAYLGAGASVTWGRGLAGGRGGRGGRAR